MRFPVFYEIRRILIEKKDRARTLTREGGVDDEFLVAAMKAIAPMMRDQWRARLMLLEERLFQQSLVSLVGKHCILAFMIQPTVNSR